MPRMCCILDCRTGRKHNTEKVSTFSFPKNEVLYDKWIEAIPPEKLRSSKKLAICAKHFTDDQIVRTWSSGTGDRQIVIDLQMPKLKKDAIPCIFFEIKSDENPASPVSSHKDDNLIDIVEVDYETFTETPLKEEPDTEPDTELDTEPDTEPSELEQFHPETPEQLFENICSNITKIVLPINWKYEVCRGKKHYISFYTVTQKDTEMGVIIEKEIILESDMVISLKVHNISFDIQGLASNSNVSSINELMSVLMIVNSKRVCAGGPLAQEFNGITVSCASIDVQNRWRHNNCPYLFDTLRNLRCIFCKRLRATFRTQKSRLSAGQSTIMVFSPTAKTLLDNCRSKARILQKQNSRAKLRIQVLQSQLNEAKEQLKSYQTTR